MILALQSCTRAERAQVETVVREGGYESVPAVRMLEILDRYDAIAEVRRRAVRFCEVALESLADLQDSPYRRALQDAAGHWAIVRPS